MRLRVLLFAGHRRTAGRPDIELELPPGATARDAAEAASVKLGLVLSGTMLAVNEVYAEPDRLLVDGDTIALVPPVAGGAPDRDHMELSERPLDVGSLHARLLDPAWGGQALFVGTTRSPNAGLVVDRLEYEAYAPMCLRVMADLAAEARAGGLELGAVVIVHRVGVVRPAEPSIVVGAASAHRRDALRALPWLVDQTKARLPVWKLEVGAGGERWVEGSTPATPL